MRRLLVAHERELHDALRRRIAGSAGARLLHRLHCVQLVHSGLACREVADSFDEHPRSVERWVRAWNEDGVKGLLDQRRSGRRPRLDPAAIRILRDDIGREGMAVHWSGRMLAGHIQSRFGIQLGVRQCQRLLLELRASEKGSGQC